MASLILVLSLVSSVLAVNNCSITPLYIDIHNRPVNAGLNIQYGMFIGVGTPSQNLSLWPDFSRNETTLAGVDYCLNTPDVNCGNETHGYFVEAVSQTFVKSLQQLYA